MKPEIIIAAASVIVALCALFLSVRQLKINRDHNKISVRPHLTTWNHTEHGNGNYAVYVLNNGIGPAVIKKFEIRVDDKVISGIGTEPIEKVLKIVFPEQKYKSSSSFMASGFALGAKENCCVTAVQFLPDFAMSKEQVEHAFNRADLVIEYESFYGEKFTLDTREERKNM